jgi:hypothetical protein
MQASDDGKTIHVTLRNGEMYCGPCWAYSEYTMKEEYGIDEACLEIGPGMLVPINEIVSIISE